MRRPGALAHGMPLASRSDVVEVGDAMINTTVDAGLVERFVRGGGERRPRFVELTVCWAEDERRARRTAHEVWALAALADPLFTELAQPSHFEAAFEPITEDRVAEAVLCGPDVRRHVDAIEAAARAGYTHVCVHQVGSDQAGFFDFYEREVLPALGEGTGRRKPAAKAGRSERRSDKRRRAGG